MDATKAGQHGSGDPEWPFCFSVKSCSFQTSRKSIQKLHFACKLSECRHTAQRSKPHFWSFLLRFPMVWKQAWALQYVWILNWVLEDHTNHGAHDGQPAEKKMPAMKSNDQKTKAAPAKKPASKKAPDQKKDQLNKKVNKTRKDKKVKWDEMRAFFTEVLLFGYFWKMFSSNGGAWYTRNELTWIPFKTFENIWKPLKASETYLSYFVFICFYVRFHVVSSFPDWPDRSQWSPILSSLSSLEFSTKNFRIWFRACSFILFHPFSFSFSFFILCFYSSSSSFGLSCGTLFQKKKRKRQPREPTEPRGEGGGKEKEWKRMKKKLKQ